MVTNGFNTGRDPDATLRSKKSGRKFFYLDGNLYRQLRYDNGHDSMTCWSYPEGKVVELPLSYVKKKRRPSYKLDQVSAMLNRSRMNMNHLFLFGVVAKPQRSYNIENPNDRDNGMYRLSDADIYRLHDYYANSRHYKAYSRSKGPLPSRSELAAMLKYEKIPYMRTSDGEFVPVWNAPDVEDWL